MKQRILSALLCMVCMAVLMLTGCDKKENSQAQARNIKEAVEMLEAEGKYPKLDRSESLAGPDEDHNGVRDDIDAYIDSLPYTPQQKGALRQGAYVNNYALQPGVDVTDPNQIAKIHKLEAIATHCTYKVFTTEEEIDSLNDYFVLLEAFTFNTKQRFDVYMKFYKAIEGTSWRLPDDTEGACDEKFIK